MDKALLKIFIAGPAQQATPAIANLHRFCQAELVGACEIEIINVLEQPELARREGIFATPTLIKVAPPPTRRILGDLSDYAALRMALGMDKS